MLLIVVTLLSLTALNAQEYKWAVGARVGGQTAGISGKYNIDGVNGIEGILSFPYKNGFLATALYERYVPVIDHGFYFFYGAGGHIGKWDSKFAVGADAIVGLEYRIPNAPLAISIDYKPTFNIASRTKFYMLDFGLGLRAMF